METYNGFANRFLWTLVKRSRLLPHGGNMAILDGFAAPLADAITKAKTKGALRRSADADDLWESVYPSLSEATAGLLGKVTERARPQVMRLALLYALLDQSENIGVAHLRAGLAVWRYCEASAALIFANGGPQAGQSKGGEQSLELKALTAICESKGITRNELQRQLRPRPTIDILTAALESLEAQGLSYRTQCNNGGRPAECWYAGREPEPDDSDGWMDESQPTPATATPHFHPSGLLGWMDESGPPQNRDTFIHPSSHADGSQSRGEILSSIHPNAEANTIASAVAKADATARADAIARANGNSAHNPPIVNRRHAEWEREYTRAQAERIARERASEPEVSQADFDDFWQKRGRYWAS